MSRPRDRNIRRTSPTSHLAPAGAMRTHGFNCHNCGVWFGVFPHTTIDAARSDASVSQSFTLECPNCKQADDYAAQEIVEIATPAPDAKQA